MSEQYTKLSELYGSKYLDKYLQHYEDPTRKFEILKWLFLGLYSTIFVYIFIVFLSPLLFYIGSFFLPEPFAFGIAIAFLFHPKISFTSYGYGIKKAVYVVDILRRFLCSVDEVRFVGWWVEQKTKELSDEESAVLKSIDELNTFIRRQDRLIGSDAISEQDALVMFKVSEDKVKKIELLNYHLEKIRVAKLCLKNYHLSLKEAPLPDPNPAGVDISGFYLNHVESKHEVQKLFIEGYEDELSRIDYQDFGASREFR